MISNVATGASEAEDHTDGASSEVEVEDETGFAVSGVGSEGGDRDEERVC